MCLNTEIVSFDKEKMTITVQPGVIRDELNLYLKPYGLFFDLLHFLDR
jgi:FAD/FMN-containing dehydrogenase